MESFLISTGLVALAEIGDKTQLLAFVLAARFRRPGPILLGILLATVFNHALAAAVGLGVAQLIGPQMLRWGLGLSFLAMAAWMLVPDELDDDLNATGSRSSAGVLLTTMGAFFLAEMGDKTQIATVALAARFDSLTAVVAGTTLGMMIANAPAVLMGERIARVLPARLMHGLAAALFAVLGVLTLVWPV